ncbi:putative transcriptional regulatory protein, partial [Lachnellula subtilissima]
PHYILSKCWYREATLRCLAKHGVFWGNNNTHSLQALVLVVYAMGHSQEPSWVLLGMTYHVAIAMGCQIDPDEFGLTAIQCEERRRCWAAFIMLYTIQNTILGNPDPSWRITNDVKLPADVKDVDITVAGIQEPFPGPTQKSYLLFKFRLYDIAANFCKETFKSYPPNTTTIQNLDQQIHLAQQEWDSRYLAHSSFESLSTHHAVHLHILHAYSHQLYLLLHRPFFAQSILGLDIPNQSQIRCIASAEALLDIHQMMFEIESFKPYMWYTDGLGSFHAFHATAVLAVALLMPIYKPQHQRFKKLLDETLFNFIPKRTFDFSVLAYFRISSRYSEETFNSKQMNIFAERLQPQQWLGPASMAWTEWDTLMADSEGIQT